MSKITLSDTMDAALQYLAWGVYRPHMEPAKKTLEALERRGMIRWTGLDTFRPEGSPVPFHDNTRLWTVTLDGWAWLKANQDMDRPADAGRLSLEDALADAEQMDADQAQVDADLGAAYALEDAEELARTAPAVLVDPSVAGTRVRVITGHHAGQSGTVIDANRGTVQNTAHPNYGRAFVTVSLDPTPSVSWSQHTRQFVDELDPIGAGRLSLEDALADAERMRGWDFTGLRGIRPEDGPEVYNVLDRGRLSLEDAWDDVTVLAIPGRVTRMYSESEFLARLQDSSGPLDGVLPAPAFDPSGLTLVMVALGLAESYEEPRSWGRAVLYRLTPQGHHRASIIRDAAVVAEADRLTHERDAAVIARYDTQTTHDVASTWEGPDLTGTLPDGTPFVADHKYSGKWADHKLAGDVQKSGRWDCPAPPLTVLPHRIPGQSLTKEERDALDRTFQYLGAPPAPGVERLADVAGHLEQALVSYTPEQALAEAYTPLGQVTCKHGRGVNDTCDDCTASTPEPDARDPHTTWVAHRLRLPATYRGISVPLDLARHWTGVEAISWARGVQAAQA